MDLNWSVDDSSSLIYWDDNEVGPRAEVTNAVEHQLVPSSRQNGLLAIDDSDFQALIEILGTDGDTDRNILNLGDQVQGDRRLLQDRQRNDRQQQGVASGVQSSDAGRARSQGNVSHSMSLIPSRLGERYSSPKPTRGHEISLSPEQSRRTSPSYDPEGIQAREADRNVAKTPNSSGSSRPTENSAAPSDTRLKPNAGFTQTKQYLGASVVDIRDQVSVLREQLQSLKAEVKEFAPHLYRQAFIDVDAIASPRNRRNSEERRSSKGKEKVVQWSKPVNGGGSDSCGDFIASLTEDEAKNVLANVCRTLHIDPLSLVTPFEFRKPEAFAPPSNLSDVARALKLVSDADEIVWRNKRNMDSGPANNIYDEENISAILDRVRLWERTARSCAGRRPDP